MRLLSRLLRIEEKSRIRSCCLSSGREWKPISLKEAKQISDSEFAVRRYLNRNPEAILDYLAISPNHGLSTMSKIRVGGKGSMVVNVEENSLIGRWYNFETGDQGDMLDLVKQKKGLSEDEVLELGRGWLRQDFLARDPPPQSRSPSSPERRIYKPNIEAFVSKILSECKPIQGTLVEEYLVKTRGLVNLPQSNNIKYHPRLPTKTADGASITSPGLVAVASHPKSAGRNIQVTVLDPKTLDKRKDVQVVKRTLGPFRQDGHFHFCTLSCQEDTLHSNQSSDGFWSPSQLESEQHKKADVTFISEGIETGLSLYQVKPEAHILATLSKSNMLQLDPEVLKSKVVLIWDNDGVDPEEDKVLLKTLRNLSEAGKTPYLLMPEAIDGRASTDLNDVLRTYGLNGLAEALKSTIKMEIKWL